MSFLLVGLGNPGKRYELTRHNIGFLVARRFAERHSLPFKKESRYSAEIAKGVIDSVRVHVLLPMTYMNLSGNAVAPYLKFNALKERDILVVLDDVHLPFGTIRLRESGSSGGHNGLKHLEERLMTQSFARLRLGVGSDPTLPLEEYVLSPFKEEERKELPHLIDRCVDTILERLASKETSPPDIDENKR